MYCCPTNSPKSKNIKFTITKGKEKQELGTIWHFCMENCLTDKLVIKIIAANSIQVE